MTTPLSPDTLRWIGVRFLDPSGRVFLHEGEFYRAIHPAKVAHVRRLFDEGIVDRLVEKGLLIPTRITDLSVEGYGLVLHHQRVPYDLRPADWNRTLLRDAARVFVDLNLELLKHGLCTIDAHGANISQIDCCRPVWLDFGSIVPVAAGDEAIVEFRRSFVNPLSLLAQPGDLGRVARALLREGGLSDSEAAALGGPLRRALNRGTELARGVRHRIAPPGRSSPTHWRERLLRAERERLEIDFPGLRTTWAGYQQNSALPPNYDQLRNSRRETILRLLTELRPKRVIDLAGNEGFFSFMAARRGAETLCLDFDEGAVESFYATARRCTEPLKLAAGCADVMQPRLRKPTGDFVLAMALTHHLTISQRFPFAHVAETLAASTTATLVTEFMPNGIGIHRVEPDPLPEWYRFEEFVAALRRHFASVEEVEYIRDPAVSPRRMILCRGRKSGEAAPA